jgi:dethiobiotin synthetase
MIEGIGPWLADDFVVVEGAGGLMSPVGDDRYVADLAHELGFPLLVVAPNRIGVINQVLLTLIAAARFRGGLPVAGVVLNDLFSEYADGDPSRESNVHELTARSPVPVLCRVQFGNPDSQVDKIDWQKAAKNARVPTWQESNLVV